MGLMIHSLGELPLEAKRSYYVYLLDYGWHEPLGEVVLANFQKMSDLSSRHDAVVLRGTVGAHFADEVLSWHHVDGQPAEDILPAILVTTLHPRHFGGPQAKQHGAFQDRLLLIPLRDACKSTSDVVRLIESIFKDIKEKKALSHFTVAKTLKEGKAGAVADALILQPNFMGLGLDVKKLVAFFRDGKQ